MRRLSCILRLTDSDQYRLHFRIQPKGRKAMLFPLRRRRRPNGWQRRGRVPRPRAAAAAPSAGTAPSAAEAEIERARMTERRRVATQVDLELRVACGMEAAARRELGDAARGLLRRRAYRRLGFVRLSDYARERLGVSARAVQMAAWVATRLDALPAVSTAFDRSDISWTHARARCAVASPENEGHWLAAAKQSSVEDLKRL